MTRGKNVLGQSVDFPKAQGFNLEVDNIWFRTIANTDVPLTIGSRDSLAERQDRAGSTYENVLDVGYAWARSDVSGGEGLDWSPRNLALYQDQAALDALRYFDSSGLNVSRPAENGEQYRLRLALAMEEWGFKPTSLHDLGVSAKQLFVAHDDEVSAFDSFDVTTPVTTWTVTSGNTELFAMAVSPNGTVMATDVDGNGYVKSPLDSTFTKFYTDAGPKVKKAKGVWFEHGRFLMSTWDEVDNAILHEVDFVADTWTEVVIDTASSPFWSVVESGPAVVAACGDGSIRTYTPDDSTSGNYRLLPRGRTTMPEGEEPILLGSNAGVLLIMTTADTDDFVNTSPVVTEQVQLIRMYQAEVLDDRFDYTVGQLQLRRTWAGTIHSGDETRSMVATRDEILWFVREVDVPIKSQLIQIVEPQESSWRFDVVTNGLSRLQSMGDIDMMAMTSYDSRYAGIDTKNGAIRVINPDKYVDDGWMIFPNVTFGVNTDISWLATIIEAQHLAPSHTQVELFRSTDPKAILDRDHDSWRLITRITNPAQVGKEIPMVNTKSKTLALQLRIRSYSSGAESPEVTNLGLRGIPSHRDLVMVVPVNVSDYVPVPGRSPLRVAGLGNKLHASVLNMVGDNVKAVLIDPPVLFNGVVNNVSEPVEFLAERGSVTRYVMVEFRGKKVSTFHTSFGNEGIGLGLLGFSTVGLGQDI